MSHAHPMIQPSAWTEQDQPDAVAKTCPQDRAALYRIIWHTSLACAMRPPLLRHTRSMWVTASGIRIAVASVNPVAGCDGYWLERRDVPSFAWPLDPRPAIAVAATIQAVHVRMRPGVSPGQLVQGVFDAGIATPASLAGLFAHLLGHADSASNPRPHEALVRFSDGPAQRSAALTQLGEARLLDWRAAGLVGRVSQRNSLVDAVEDGSMPYRDALTHLTEANKSLGPLADAVARQIDDLCAQWKGMGRDEALQAQSSLAHRPPRLTALPSWIDPDVQIAADHPLRAWRQRMEGDLARSEAVWASLDDPARAEHRLQWLLDHAAQIEADGGGVEFKAAMHPETGRFSALRYWLTGITA